MGGRVVMVMVKLQKTCRTSQHCLKFMIYSELKSYFAYYMLKNIYWTSKNIIVIVYFDNKIALSRIDFYKYLKGAIWGGGVKSVPWHPYFFLIGLHTRWFPGTCLPAQIPLKWFPSHYMFFSIFSQVFSLLT